MRTNIEIDEVLMAEAMEAFAVKTKREAVHESMKEAVRLRRQRRALEGLWGLGWEGDLEAMRTEKPLEWD